MLMIQYIFKRAFLLINLSRKIFYVSSFNVYFISNLSTILLTNAMIKVVCLN